MAWPGGMRISRGSNPCGQSRQVLALNPISHHFVYDGEGRSAKLQTLYGGDSQDPRLQPRQPATRVPTSVYRPGSMRVVYGPIGGLKSPKGKERIHITGDAVLIIAVSAGL